MSCLKLNVHTIRDPGGGMRESPAHLWSGVSQRSGEECEKVFRSAATAHECLNLTFHTVHQKEKTLGHGDGLRFDLKVCRKAT